MTEVTGNARRRLWLAATVAIIGFTGANAAWAQAQPSGSLSGSYLAGRHAIGIDDFDVALSYLSHASSRDPANAEVMRTTLSLAIASGQLDRAARTAQRLYRLNQDEQLARSVLLLEDIRAGRYDAAAAKLEGIQREGISTLIVPLIQAWVEYGRGDLEAATAALDTLASTQGIAALVAEHRALILDLAGDVAGARAAYDQATGAASMPRLVLLAGSFLERNGDTAAAGALYRKLIGLQPESMVVVAALDRMEQGLPPPAPLAGPAQGVAEALFQIAGVIAREGSDDLALMYARFATHLDPQFDLGQLLVGDLLGDRQLDGDAIAVYGAVDPATPAGWMARLRIASALDRLDRDDEAIALLDELAAAYPERAEPLVQLGDLYRIADRYADAVGAYDAAEARVPDVLGGRWSFLYRRGMALERAQDWTRAEADLKRAVELNPDHAHLLNYLGYSWIDRGQNLAEGEAMVQKAIELAPEDGYIVDSLGWAYYRTGRYAEAVETLERAVALMPDDPTLNDHLGDAYWVVGRQAEARYQWRRALRDNEDTELNQAIEQKLLEGLPVAAPTTPIDERAELPAP